MRVIFAFLMFFCTSVAAQRVDGIGFKNVPLGSSSEEFWKTIPDGKCQKSTCAFHSFQCRPYERIGVAECMARNRWGPIDPVSVGADFVNDKLVSVAVIFSSTDFAILRIALTNRYGTPSSVVERNLQTRAGVRLTSLSLRWENNDEVLLVDEHGSNIDRGVARIYTLDHEKREREKLKEGIRESSRGM